MPSQRVFGCCSHKLFRIRRELMQKMQFNLCVVGDSLANRRIAIATELGSKLVRQLSFSRDNASHAFVWILSKYLEYLKWDRFVVGYPLAQFRRLGQYVQPNLQRCVFRRCSVVF